MNVFYIIFGNSGQPFLGQPLVAVSESRVFLCAEDHAAIFLRENFGAFVYFLELWVLEKIHLKFVKPWEMKSL